MFRRCFLGTWMTRAAHCAPRNNITRFTNCYWGLGAFLNAELSHEENNVLHEQYQAKPPENSEATGFLS